MKRTGTPGDTGQTLLHLHHSPTPIPSCPLFPSSTRLFLPLFSSFYRGRLQAQPARIWSVALGVRGPRLLNKGADWLIDRPSAVPAPRMFPGSLPYIRILCWLDLPLRLLNAVFDGWHQFSSKTHMSHLSTFPPPLISSSCLHLAGSTIRGNSVDGESQWSVAYSKPSASGRVFN